MIFMQFSIRLWIQTLSKLNEILSSYQARDSLYAIKSFMIAYRRLTPPKEIIALRTAKKRQPGKKIAIYIGIVMAILVISYNLIKDISFVIICDKDYEWLGIFWPDRNRMICRSLELKAHFSEDLCSIWWWISRKNKCTDFAFAGRCRACWTLCGDHQCLRLHTGCKARFFVMKSL